VTALVSVEHRDAVAVLRMERPDALNALDDKLASDLLETVEAVGRDAKVRAVVLTGAGRAFCAGGDLRWLAGYDGPDSGEPMRQLTKLFDPMAIELRRMPKAIVAAVNGVAAGAGLSLALCCDFRISARSAFYRVAYGNIAVSPDGGLTWLLPRVVGRPAAARLALRGKDVDADEALRLGLVDGVVADEALLDTALTLAEELAARPGEALGYTKRLLDTSWTSTFETQLEDERAAIVATGRTAAHREALAGFLDRAP
jgi:2-(1,2-epoxy-1,2-dihydrophenyl)acetyl-CoA isomerase